MYDGGIVTPQNMVNTITYNASTPLFELQRKFATKNGYGGSYYDENWMTPGIPIAWGNICVGLQYWSMGTDKPGVVVPGSSCAVVPPPNVTCSPVGDMVFDYGTVSPTVLDGITRDEGQTITCTGAVSVRFKLTSDLILTPGLTADLSVNGAPISMTQIEVPVQNGVNQLNFRSVLRGRTDVVGDVVASTVMIMEYL